MTKLTTAAYCGLFAAIVSLAGCGASTESAVTPNSVRPARVGHQRSWMSPLAGKKSKLLYVSAFDGNDVSVYDYPAGTSVGTLTGFTAPSGQCVDAKGDVYIADYGTGAVDEYAHGGTSPIKTFSTPTDAFGCSVDKNGDLAVTDFQGPDYGAGSVTVFPNGSTTGVVYSNPTNCYYIWPAGYDNSGNLIMIAENQASESVTICALLKGSSSLTTVDASGFTIYSPNSTMWDGKYIALGDQQLGGSSQSGVIEATLSDSTLTYHAQIALSDPCDQGYTHVVLPFIVGHKNTPVNDKQSVAIVGSNEFCHTYFRFWHYPKGGRPFKGSTLQSAGQSVSIGK